MNYQAVHGQGNPNMWSTIGGILAAGKCGWIDYTQREFSMISVISLLDFVLVHAYRIL